MIILFSLSINFISSSSSSLPSCLPIVSLAFSLVLSSSTFSTFSFILSLSVYLSLCPHVHIYPVSPNLRRNAYSEEVGDDFDEEAVSLTSGGVKMLGDVVNKLERKDRKATSTLDHPFGIGENLEEDKRE